MKMNVLTRYCRKALFVAATLAAGNFANATTVQFQTSLGDFEVILFDENTPKTVENFLQYVSDGAYTDSVIHRLAPNFVVQGGGFIFNDEAKLESIESRPAVVNEPEYSNLRGTIAMAKLGGNPDSATNQWYFNLGNNSANLDLQNGGFTVFGQVKDDGMDIVDAMADQTIFNMGGSFTTVPLVDYTSEDASNGVEVEADNFITIYAITVTDAATDTLGDLSPAKNTLITAQPTPAPSSGGGGGGSMPWAILAMLAAAGWLRRR
ncbi:peptidylprolyl isomerase [Teredinibacter turnerae]|uniref:peptidylprolyl isomerase n=1 Tax=Teredinibacter turnerae TaxID=2426 RepID=UPI0030D23668